MHQADLKPFFFFTNYYVHYKIYLLSLTRYFKNKKELVKVTNTNQINRITSDQNACPLNPNRAKIIGPGIWISAIDLSRKVMSFSSFTISASYP